MYVCDNCKKGTSIGIDSTHQYGGGWSMRGQATRKVWKPNLHALKIKHNGKTVTRRLCAKCTRVIKAKIAASYKKPAAQPAA